MSTIVIIDPASTEVNRGSFCYLPYILYNSMRREFYSTNLHFFENFTIPDINKLPDDKSIVFLVALWSYPQVEAALTLNKFLPGDVLFFGYYPLIKALGLREYRVDDTSILRGMRRYPENYGEFEHLLLSDCDMHLKKYPGQVVPLFTSYGCPSGCAFCPSTVNCDKSRIHLPVEEVRSMLDECAIYGVTNIHFTDEDFFFDPNRAYLILSHAARSKANFNFIALGSVSKVLLFIQRYGQQILHDAGMRLIEVGFETGDAELAKEMGKAPVARCEELARISSVPIFWLTLTFFPGETINTLNQTGQFLKEHGFKPEELYGRVRTNGTEGGLGQFFQPYHGTKDYEKIEELGKVLTTRPVRLIPSFIPYSFMGSKILFRKDPLPKDQYWFDLYKVPMLDWSGMDGFTVYKAVNTFKQKEEFCKYTETDIYVSAAISARLGHIV